MNDDIEQLNDTFAAHEHLAPNAADVLARANVLARSYRRRRRAAQATGASVLSAGIVAGSVALPGLKWHHASQSGVSVAGTGVGNGVPGSPSATAPVASPNPTPTFSDNQALAEYFADGYDVNNATALASLWHQTDLSLVKVKAGTLLLQGSALPVIPNGTPESADQKQQDQDLNAFFAAGYDYNDALTLRQLWNETDVVQVKADAGKMLLAGQTLPIKPTPVTSPTATPGAGDPAASNPAADPAQESELNAYFGAGYNYDDAIQLGKLWNQTDVLQIKTEAGQKLLAGQTLPVAP